MTYKYAKMPVYTGLTEEKINEITADRQNLIDLHSEKIMLYNKTIEKQIEDLNLNPKITNALRQADYTAMVEGIDRVFDLSSLKYNPNAQRNNREHCYYLGRMLQIYNDNKKEIDENILKYNDFLALSYQIRHKHSDFNDCDLKKQMKQEMQAYDAELKKYNEYCLAVLNSKKLEALT